ncbi:MAG: Mce/MlaD family protein [Solirubrobacteraceae bacterium]
MSRLAITGAVLAGLAVLFVNSKYDIMFGGVSSYPHYLQTVVPSAYEVIPGERMVAGGETVGEITGANVTRSGLAHVTMGLDSSVWPLPSDTVLTLRMGGTIKYTDRFVSIDKGRAATNFSERAVVPAKQFIVPVEYDQLFNVFNKPTRQAMKSFFANTGQAFKQAVGPFHQALPLAPPVLDQAAAVFRDLGYDQQALSTLVSSTAQVSDAVATANPGLQALIQSAGETFGTIAQQSNNVQQLIRTIGPSLHTQGVLYYHVGRDLPKIAKLAALVKPGLDQLNTLASPLNSTLQELVSVEPLAVHTLNTVRTAGPSIDTLLTSARTTLMPELAQVAPKLASDLNCIRPYTPDVIGFIQGWAGFLGQDGQYHPHGTFLHTLLSVLPMTDSMPMNTKQYLSMLPPNTLGVQLQGMPGSSWAQQWPQPQCNVTYAGYNPANDAEANTYDQNGSKLVPYPSH